MGLEIDLNQAFQHDAGLTSSGRHGRKSIKQITKNLPPMLHSLTRNRNSPSAELRYLCS
jgi:hypothetical protein